MTQTNLIEVIAGGLATFLESDDGRNAGYLGLAAQAVLVALEAEGLVVVPKEPTENQLIRGNIAARRVFRDEQGRRCTEYPPLDQTRAVYDAMIAAAQPQPAQGEGT